VTHIFIPSPNDAFSPRTGSANATRLHEISRRHMARGGRARFIMGRDALCDYPVSECVRVDYPPQLRDEHRRQDLISGWLGRPRRFRGGRYLPAAQAIEPDFDGPIFLYNDAACLRHFRERSPRAKLILYCGNLIWKTFSPFEVRQMLKLADCIICISDFLASSLKRRLRLACAPWEYSQLAARIVVIANGVDLEMFRPAAVGSTPDNTADHPPTIVFVGRIQPVKGAHVLIAAANELQRAGKEFRVRIVGSRAFRIDKKITPYEEELRRLAAPLGEKIEFQPFVDRNEIAAQYQSAAIFCMPSVWAEPFGLTLLEGMACGLATVASQRGAIPEIGADAAQYFNPAKPTELARILSRLLADETERCAWGVKARERAEVFSWDRHYRKLCAALKPLGVPAAGAADGG
jgi:glycosyltransferase involved in cell wall biosynthesis